MSRYLEITTTKLPENHAAIRARWASAWGEDRHPNDDAQQAEAAIEHLIAGGHARDLHPNGSVRILRLIDRLVEMLGRNVSFDITEGEIDIRGVEDENLADELRGAAQKALARWDRAQRARAPKRKPAKSASAKKGGRRG